MVLFKNKTATVSTVLKLKFKDNIRIISADIMS